MMKFNAGSISLTQAPAAGAKIRVIRRDNLINLIVIRGLSVNDAATMHGGCDFKGLEMI
jgi:hypothetical protein